MTGIRSQLARGAAWVITARLIRNGSAFVGTIILARLITPEDFGLVAIATTIAFIVSSVTELSLTSALIHLREIDDDHLHTAWTLNMARGTVLGALLCGLAAPIAWLYGDERLFAVMLAVGGVTFVGGLANPRMVIFTRGLQFWQESAISVANKLAGLLVSVAIALTFRTYWAIIAGLAAGQVVTVLMSYVVVPFRPRLKLAGMRAMLSYSVWLSLGQAVNTFNWKSDHLLIGYFIGNAPLGYYSVGNNLSGLPTREAIAPLMQTLFPGFSKLTDDPARLRDAYRRSQSLLCAIAFPAGFGLALVAEPAVLVAMGEKWAPAIPVIQFLAGIFAVQTLASTVQPLAMAMGRTRTLFNRDSLNFGIRMPLIIGGILTGGLMGAIYARCVSGIVSTLINMILVRGLLDLPLRSQLADNARTIVATAAMVAGVSLLWLSFDTATGAHQLLLQLLVMIPTGAVLYLATLLACWLVQGRPDGPERELVQMVTKFFQPFLKPAGGERGL